MNQYVKAESIELIFSGDNYFDVLQQIIEHATATLHLQTYIFEEDETGKKIIKRLKAAARRGVRVFVLADAFGSKKLPKELISQLRTDGIHFRFFSPLFSSESIALGRRLHHKIVVADKTVSLAGGINIANTYRGTRQETPWLDYAVLVKGNCCEYLHHLCRHLYERKKMVNQENSDVENNEGERCVRFRRNDWLRRKNEVVKSYREAIVSAEKTITIVAGYFLPGFLFINLLKKAVRRGVTVRIIRADKTDVPFFRLAEKYLYRYLLKTGIEIYEWQNSVLHGKAILVDEKWSSIGSHNLDYLSHYRNIELNVDVKDIRFCKLFSEHLETVISGYCIKLTPEMLPDKKGLFQVLKTSFAYHFFRIILNTFLPRKKAKPH